MINSIARHIIEKFNVNKFVETGVLQGDTLTIVSSWFSDLYKNDFITQPGDSRPPGKYVIYEIDIDGNAIGNANRIKQGQNNIIPIEGNSIDVLNKLITDNTFTENDSPFFYLDAHSPGNEPLRGEIEQLKRLDFPCIISIDDFAVPQLEKNDVYSIDTIRDLISDKTDVIYLSAITNIHWKMCCFIFFGHKKEQLSPILKELPLIEVDL